MIIGEEHVYKVDSTLTNALKFDNSFKGVSSHRARQPNNQHA